MEGKEAALPWDETTEYLLRQIKARDRIQTRGVDIDDNVLSEKQIKLRIKKIDQRIKNIVNTEPVH